jgi:hypothetical protein
MKPLTHTSLLFLSLLLLSCDDPGGCKNPRQFGDYGSGDQCWAPPQHYCSSGVGSNNSGGESSGNSGSAGEATRG